MRNLRGDLSYSATRQWAQQPFWPYRIPVQFTPDDGYYYLGLARNYVYTGLWTFALLLATGGLWIVTRRDFPRVALVNAL